MLRVHLKSRLVRFELGSKIMYARVDAMELSFEEGVGVPCNKEMRPGDDIRNVVICNRSRYRLEPGDEDKLGEREYVSPHPSAEHNTSTHRLPKSTPPSRSHPNSPLQKRGPPHQTPTLAGRHGLAGERWIQPTNLAGKHSLVGERRSRSRGGIGGHLVAGFRVL